MAKKITFALLMLAMIISLFSACSSSSSSAGSSSSTKKPGTIEPPPTFTMPEIETLDPDIWNSIDWDAINSSNKFYVSWKAKLISNNSVGSDWGKFVTVGGENVGSSPITVSGNVLTVDVKAVEYDSLNDVGRGSIDFYCDEITTSQTQTIRINVRENRGRYSGNVAVWEFTVTVTRAK